MPPHLRPITQICSKPGCERIASQELRNTNNGIIGVYCSTHAGKALEEFISWTEVGAQKREGA